MNEILERYRKPVSRAYSARKLSYQSCGSAWLLKINADSPAELEGIFYSLFNRGATCSKEVFPLGDDCSGYVVIAKRGKRPEAIMREYFISRWRDVLLNRWPDRWKGKPGGVIPTAKKLAARDFSSLQREIFFFANTPADVYTIGKITAEKPDADFKDAFLAKASGAEA